ncbi:MAG: putative metal-binding motif-containing protein [Myxococcota bacterium]|nr:putative metal-binding motif-containing protein [Myxococcota bacterium]
MKTMFLCVALGAVAFGCRLDEGGGSGTRGNDGKPPAAGSGAIPAGATIVTTRALPAGPPRVTHVVGLGRTGCGVPGNTDPNPACRTDRDGDQVVAAFDCNDQDPAVSPAVADVPCDGKDQDCNGYDDCDRDHDGIQAAFDLDDAKAKVGATREEEP